MVINTRLTVQQYKEVDAPFRQFLEEMSTDPGPFMPGIEFLINSQWAFMLGYRDDPDLAKLGRKTWIKKMRSPDMDISGFYRPSEIKLIQAKVDEHDTLLWGKDLLGLYATIRITNPDRIVAVASGGVPLCGIAHAFGYAIDYIGVKGNERIPTLPLQHSDFSNSDQLLLVEDCSQAYVGDSYRDPTYKSIKAFISNQFGVSLDNITVFIGDINLRSEEVSRWKRSNIDSIKAYNKDNAYVYFSNRAWNSKEYWDKPGALVYLKLMRELCHRGDSVKLIDDLKSFLRDPKAPRPW